MRNPLLISLGLALAATLPAQTCNIVKDINTTPAAASSAGSNPFDIQLGGRCLQKMLHQERYIFATFT